MKKGFQYVKKFKRFGGSKRPDLVDICTIDFLRSLYVLHMHRVSEYLFE